MESDSENTAAKTDNSGELKSVSTDGQSRMLPKRLPWQHNCLVSIFTQNEMR